MLVKVLAASCCQANSFIIARVISDFVFSYEIVRKTKAWAREMLKNGGNGAKTNMRTKMNIYNVITILFIYSTRLNKQSSNPSQFKSQTDNTHITQDIRETKYFPSQFEYLFLKSSFWKGIMCLVCTFGKSSRDEAVLQRLFLVINVIYWMLFFISFAFRETNVCFRLIVSSGVN